MVAEGPLGFSATQPIVRVAIVRDHVPCRHSSGQLPAAVEVIHEVVLDELSTMPNAVTNSASPSRRSSS